MRTGPRSPSSRRIARESTRACRPTGWSWCLALGRRWQSFARSTVGSWTRACRRPRSLPSSTPRDCGRISGISGRGGRFARSSATRSTSETTYLTEVPAADGAGLARCAGRRQADPDGLECGVNGATRHPQQRTGKMSLSNKALQHAVPSPQAEKEEAFDTLLSDTSSRRRTTKCRNCFRGESASPSAPWAWQSVKIPEAMRTALSGRWTTECQMCLSALSFFGTHVGGKQAPPIEAICEGPRPQSRRTQLLRSAWDAGPLDVSCPRDRLLQRRREQQSVEDACRRWSSAPLDGNRVRDHRSRVMHEQRQSQEPPTLSQCVLGDLAELSEVMQWLALEDSRASRPHARRIFQPLPSKPRTKRCSLSNANSAL